MEQDLTIPPVNSDPRISPTRRTLFPLLGMGILTGGLASLAAPETTEARKKRKKRKKKKKGKGGGKGKCNGNVNGSASASDEDALLQMINSFRQQNGGLPPLTRQAQLDSAAVAHSQDMARRCFFAHINPDGIDPFQRMKAAGYTGVPTAENIYKGSGNLGSAAQAFDTWKNSKEGHRENMLSANSSEIGIGTALDSSGYMIWTNVFGRQPPG